ncbi:MAG TPA: hypothetical protein VFA20_29940 [Myxococcaceae bacterium]|nr:hypothetical protein [Myxococcaceae bacterium]
MADGFQKPTVNAVRPPVAEALAPTTAELFKDTQRIGTPKWSVDVADAMTAGGKLQTPLSYGEKASFVDLVRGLKMRPPKPLDAAQPTLDMRPEQLAAYNALSPQDRARYDQLHAEATANHQDGPYGTPVASPRSSVSNLRRMLTSGELGNYFKVEDSLAGAGEQAKTDLHQSLFQGILGNRGNRGGSDTTLSYLTQLTDPNTTLLPGLDRQKLVTSLLHDINHPEEIQQGEGTMNCGASNAAFFVATNNPTEYVRELSSLATKGEVQLDPLVHTFKNLFAGKDDGSTMKFNGQIDPNSKTSPTSQLYDAAFTASAKQTTTDSTKQPATTKPGTDGTKPGLDRTRPNPDGSQSTPFGDRVGKLKRLMENRGRGGINGTQMAEEMSRMGFQWDAAFMPPANDPSVTQGQRDAARKTGEAVLQNASPRAPVFANVNGHWVGVTDYNPQTGAIQYFDPNQHKHGQPPTIQTMTADDLFKGASDLVYLHDSASGVQVPDYMHNTAWSRNGGGGSPTTGLGSGGGSGGSGRSDG